MLAKVDKHSGIPAYVQIMSMIKTEILLGRLKEGDKLPTIRDLSDVFDVNVNTVIRALEKLEMEGIVEAKHGVGYFIKGGTALDGSILQAIKECVDEVKKAGIDLNTFQVLVREVWRSGT